MSDQVVLLMIVVILCIAFPPIRRMVKRFMVIGFLLGMVYLMIFLMGIRLILQLLRIF